LESTLRTTQNFKAVDPHTNDYFEKYKRLDNFMMNGTVRDQEKWRLSQGSEFSISQRT